MHTSLENLHLITIALLGASEARQKDERECVKLVDPTSRGIGLQQLRLFRYYAG